MQRNSLCLKHPDTPHMYQEILGIRNFFAFMNSKSNEPVINSSFVSPDMIL